MVRVYHLLLIVLCLYWALKDLLLTIPCLELQLWDIHSHLTHLSNLAPAQTHLQRDVTVFAVILERVLQAAISTRDQLTAQNQALEALTTAVGLACQAHQSSNDFLLTMSETLQLLTRSIQELSQESEVNEAITLLCQIQEDTRYTQLVAEVDDPALQRHSESPAPCDPTPPFFGPNSPCYVPSSPTTTPPFAPLVLDISSPPCVLSPLPLLVHFHFGPPTIVAAPEDVISDTPSTAVSLSPRGSSASYEPAKPDLRINYRIPVHYYPSQQDNDSFIQWELEDWDMIPYGGETFMLAHRRPDHNPRFMALTVNGHRIVAPTKKTALLPRSEFFIPQTAGRLPSGSVIHEDRLYFDQTEIYFDHDTRRWRSRVGDNPLSDKPFLGPEYVPGNPEEELPTHLRTQSTAVVGPINPGTVFSANTESSDEEGTSGTDNALEYVSADQEEDAELEQQEEGNQSETHQETVIPPTLLNLELLQIEPPVDPITTTPDVEMSQAAPQNNHQGGGGGAKLPLPEDFTGVRSKCSRFLASIRAYFSFYLNQFASDAQKITLALMCCKGAASTWRDSEFAKFDTDPVSHGTWNEFRTRFINQSEEVSAMASAMIKIQKLELGKKYNMTQLISRFDELIPYCKIQDNEPMKIHFFTQCFPDNIKTHIFLKNPMTYDDARKYATEFGLAYDRIDADNGK
ncbi:hypothetical protein M378DRAFT_16946 [Amanita muscaria Koide BX008]|uniref:Ty3 transposon capsid-like protein domain-containing protein n=1 Tax=Amanita muscaria (strain Koide BX008) TaxID=946122 RepID=A0A0C2S1U1_AMAMK|nr:hypothetical protein M378DRAFT_16946 [Amanita muscaria Koide BX008]